MPQLDGGRAGLIKPTDGTTWVRAGVADALAGIPVHLHDHRRRLAAVLLGAHVRDTEAQRLDLLVDEVPVVAVLVSPLLVLRVRGSAV